MNHWTGILKRLALFAWTGLFWLAGNAALWAAELEEEAEGSSANYTMSYILIVLAIGLGLVSDRWRPRRVINVGSFAAIVAPIFALAAHVTRSPILIWAYPAVFVALGIAGSSAWSGFHNYLLSSVPDANRATYVGLGNTIAGLITLAPVVGGCGQGFRPQ